MAILISFFWGISVGLGSEETDTFFSPEQDYSRFSGRITDKDDTGHLIKVKSENPHIRFFKNGDLLEFTIPRIKKRPCPSYVKSLESGYLILYVKDFAPCWGDKRHFRRGTALVFKSYILQERVESASRHRRVLLKRKRDYLNQLNGANHFIGAFGQKKVQTARDFDRQILEIKGDKNKAIKNLVVEKEEQIKLQRELMKRLERLEAQLDFYRIGKYELFTDRWHMDLQLGLPVTNRPQKEKPKRNKRNDSL